MTGYSRGNRINTVSYIVINKFKDNGYLESKIKECTICLDEILPEEHVRFVFVLISMNIY